jgi:hypothetical protein
MGGIYIDCGSFAGEDKSAKAILFVLAGMRGIADPDALPILTRLIADVTQMLHTSGASTTTETEIASGDAAVLLPYAHRYRDQLEQSLGPIRDPYIAIANDRRDGIFLEGRGRQYHCVLDLERAFEVSLAEQQPVVISWD